MLCSAIFSAFEKSLSSKKSKPFSSVRNFLATVSVWTHCLKKDRNREFTVF